MKAFFKEKKRSAGYARDRMKLLLISERIDCTPQMMKMLRNDIDTYRKKLPYLMKNSKNPDYAGTCSTPCVYSCFNKKDNRLVSSQLLKKDR